MANRASGFLQQILIAEIHADRHRQRGERDTDKQEGEGEEREWLPSQQGFLP